MKVRCENCDAVFDAPEERIWVGIWKYFVSCYHCYSFDTIKTDEPYRLPKWEGNPPTLGVSVEERINVSEKLG